MPEWLIAVSLGTVGGMLLGMLFGLILAFVHSLGD